MIRYQNIGPFERFVRSFLGLMGFIFWAMGSVTSPLWVGLSVVLILSGILAPENAQVRAAFAAVALSWPIESRVMGEWSDVQLKRP